MLKLGFLSITGCSFWNIFFPPRGGLGPKGCVGRTLMQGSTNQQDYYTKKNRLKSNSFDVRQNVLFADTSKFGLVL